MQEAVTFYTNYPMGAGRSREPSYVVCRLCARCHVLSILTMLIELPGVVCDLCARCYNLSILAILMELPGVVRSLC